MYYVALTLSQLTRAPSAGMSAPLRALDFMLCVLSFAPTRSLCVRVWVLAAYFGI